LGRPRPDLGCSAIGEREREREREFDEKSIDVSEEHIESIFRVD
jgi:hypothetical protein